MTDDLPDDPAVVPDGFDLTLVLGGGNALGAYHLGVCEALLARGATPGHVVGASVGAVTGAILLGNAPDRRVERLRGFWRDVAQPGSPWLAMLPPEARARWSNIYGLGAALTGRSSLSALRLPGLWSLLPGAPPDQAVQDLSPLRQTLERIVDWDRLNDAPERLSILAVDVDTAEEVWFDTSTDRIGPDHILASAALLPLFPPVEIDGRRLCDGGMRSNLPVERAFAQPLDRPLLCVASDLFGLGRAEPASLDRVVTRAQDLAFAAQARRGIAAVARERALLRRLDRDEPSAILVHLAQESAPHERSLKTLDFSVPTLAERIQRGRDDVAAMVVRLAGAPRDEALAVLGPDRFFA